MWTDGITPSRISSSAAASSGSISAELTYGVEPALRPLCRDVIDLGHSGARVR